MRERAIQYKVLTLDYPRRKGRIDVYDFLRGFAMLLVMLQHAGCPGNHYILTFHMPLFFFLSGLVGGGRELPPFKDYFVSRFKRLMVPYFCFGFLMLTVYWVTGMMNHHPYDVLSAAYGVLTCQLGYAPIGTNGLYWFLPCMFVADLLVYPISRYLRSCRFGNWGGGNFVPDTLIPNNASICHPYIHDTTVIYGGCIFIGGKCM